MNDLDLEYECCFCGKNIESSPTDPCAINVTINIDKAKSKQYDQDFYCHIKCFKKGLTPMVSLYIEHLGHNG